MQKMCLLLLGLVLLVQITGMVEAMDKSWVKQPDEPGGCFANCCGHKCNNQDMLVANGDAQGNCWCKPANKCFTDNGGTRRCS
ncbi:hypothetical protein BV898_03533 [Hypsibius exemplaris]|uniref:Uncharacterized protein n=1 Tax=Hypsibius exemplaris TaxID=2072580 RepID=A0A1W0X5P5_HYPEX|nr:hypothetical protein BV898_03533 [Hypsibius exemplaris]